MPSSITPGTSGPKERQSAARAELFGGMWNGHSDEEANRRIDAFHIEVLNTAADSIVASCPDHSDADRAWMDCHCVVAEELDKAAKAITQARMLALRAGESR